MIEYDDMKDVSIKTQMVRLVHLHCIFCVVPVTNSYHCWPAPAYTGTSSRQVAFFCCNQIAIRWSFTPHVFTRYVSLVSTSKFDRSFPLNLTLSHTGFVVVWIVPITVDLFISPNCVSLLSSIIVACCWVDCNIFLLLIFFQHVASTFPASFSTSSSPATTSCLRPGFTATSLTYLRPQSCCTWIGNAFASHTCVQCDHSVFLTPPW